MAASFSHPGRPAIAGALSTHTGAGAIGLKSKVAPFSHCSLTNSPFSFRGVWQSPHRPTSSTRYLPRATLTDAGACTLDFFPASIGATSRVSVATLRINRCTSTPPMPRAADRAADEYTTHSIVHFRGRLSLWGVSG